MNVKRRMRMQVRATPDAGDGTFEALVSTYELEYDIGWGWTEQIARGCFDASIAAHPTLPIFYNHQWDAAPIGSAAAREDGPRLIVAGRLYLGMGDMVARVYQAMVDEALEEWSIGFWPEKISWTDDNPLCDVIELGDLAEASICVRGANPETGTLELNSRSQPVYLMGDTETRKREVTGLRSRRQIETRDDTAGHSHEHAHGDGTHTHDHTHSSGNYDHGQDGADPDNEVTHAHSHDDDAPPVTGEDPGMDEDTRARVERALWSPHWADEVTELRNRLEGAR